MSKVDEDVLRLTTATGQSLLVTAAGGVVTSGLIAMLASADAFAARLLSGYGRSSEPYALNDMVKFAKDLTPRPDTTKREFVNERTFVSGGPAPGAPVVT